MLNEVKHLFASHCDFVEIFHSVQYDSALVGDSPCYNFELLTLNS